MIDRKTLTSLALWVSVAAFSILLLTGCNMNHPIIKEMEAASTSVSGNIKHEEWQRERDKAVSRAVQKYFPPGMKSEEAFKLLRQLKEQGFDVSEWRHEGARNWPDGEIKPYLNEETRRSTQLQIPEGESRFYADKQYGVVPRWLATKHVNISFRVIDGSGVISEVKGDIWASGL